MNTESKIGLEEKILPGVSHKIVLVVGVFDLFHRGHVELLKTARSYGTKLCVAINSDDFTAQYKRRPIMPEADRLAIVNSCRYVEESLISETNDVKPIIERFGVNVIVHGDDWAHGSYLQQICVTEEYIAEKGIEMIYTPYYSGESTSKLLKRIALGFDS